MPAVVSRQRIDFFQEQAAVVRGIQNPAWDLQSGLGVEALREGCREIAHALSGASRTVVKARMLAYILDNARLAINPHDVFADRLEHGHLLLAHRAQWLRAAEADEIAQVIGQTNPGKSAWAWDAMADFSHTAPDWARVVRLGVPGILAHVRQARAAQGTLTAAQREFYDACEMVWAAIVRLLRRMQRAAAALPDTPVTRTCAALLGAAAERAPQTFPEALALISVLYVLQNDLEGTALRSLGRLDQHLAPLYHADLARGRYAAQELDDFLRFFFCRIDAMNHPNNLPICLGPINALSERMQAVYDDLGLYCPKMQVRVGDGMPDDFLKRVLDSIRRGNSSYVFVNDAVVVPGLERLGIAPADARNYVPVGCYEPMALGQEVPCTCAGTVNLPKMVELALNDGRDPRTGAQIGPHTGRAEALASAQAFEQALRTQLEHAIEQVQRRVRAYEGVMMRLNPSPIFSATLAACVERGQDAYAGGARYNNASINCIGLAGAVDSVMAVRKLVYAEQRTTLAALRDVLRADWQGAEALRRQALRCPKYGSGDAEADALAAQLCAQCAERINNVPNARGGVFRLGLFSIDWIYNYGRGTGATPDGRRAAEPLSKNLSATLGMDKAGPTALMRAATAPDAADAVNGAVLDMMLHPTAVQGAAGLDAMLALLRAFCRQGGQCLQFNVLDAQVLRRAKTEPEKYAALQVRVCGWNARFVNLSAQEQDDFIRQAALQEAAGG